MTRSRGSALAASLLGATVLSGCAGIGLTPAAPITTPGAVSPPSPSGPTPSSSTPAVPATPDVPSAPVIGSGSPSSAPAQSPGETPSTPPQVATISGGNGSAKPLLVPTSALPSGWAATQARDTRGYRMKVCGVDIEPSQPVDGAQQNWSASLDGPHLEQHVRVYDDDTATKVTDALKQKIPGCTTYTAEDSAGGRSTFAVEKLPLQGAPSGTIAWRQRVDIPVPGSAASTGTETPSPTPQTVEVVQDIAVKRTGAAVVLLNTYAVERNPDDAALIAALKASG